MCITKRQNHFLKFAFMFSAIKRISLILAWGILFAHSVVPHAHESNAELGVCASSHEHDESLLEALSHIFHFNIGEDHLEDYQAGNGQLVFCAPNGFEVSIPFASPNEVLAKPQLNLYQKDRYRHQSLRAPPSYS